jgi:hypothetical protein
MLCSNNDIPQQKGRTPERKPWTQWTACVHFPDSYSIDVFHLSFNFLCLLFLCVSISMVLTLLLCVLLLTAPLSSPQVTLTFQPSPPDQVFWTKKEVYYQPTINLAEGLQICVRQMEA